MRRLATLGFTILVLTACSPAATTSTTTPKSTAPTTSESVSTTTPESTPAITNFGTEGPIRDGFAVFEPAPSDRNWLQVSNSTGAFLDEEPELCLILDGGEAGKIDTFNFSLEWSDGDWSLTWLNRDGTYKGPVGGSVDGMEVTFSGEFDGMAVKGSVNCLEP